MKLRKGYCQHSDIELWDMKMVKYHLLIKGANHFSFKKQNVILLFLKNKVILMKYKKRSNFPIKIDDRTPHKLIDTRIKLPSELVDRFDIYPENRRRSVNKILFKNKFFNLTYSMNTKELSISSRGDIVYSAIPYDTARKYIQSASIQYLLNPVEARQYIERHKGNLETYIKLGIFQLTGKRVNKNSVLVKQAYNEIFENPLFEIQILGRLLQHDETGPISANIPGKFLFSENVNTGISEYISEYLNFVIQLTKSLPVTTDGISVKLLKSSLINKRNSRGF